MTKNMVVIDDKKIVDLDILEEIVERKETDGSTRTNRDSVQSLSVQKNNHNLILKKLIQTVDENFTINGKETNYIKLPKSLMKKERMDF
jgi:hypothetical protein